MKIRTQYFLAFLSATLVTLILAGTGLWGFNNLQRSTDYLVNINSSVLEYSSLFEKVLAQSRRAEKEFFLFPDKPEKQEKYIASWGDSYGQIYTYIEKLRTLFEQTGNTSMLAKLDKVQKAMAENENDFAVVIQKFQESKSYDLVEAAEYGAFKARTHAIEDISSAMTQFGLKEMERGRAELASMQKKLVKLGRGISLIALVLGILVPLFLAQHMTRYIIKLTDCTIQISRGDLTGELPLGRKDELGDLANALDLIKKSLKIMLKKASRK